MEQLKSNNIKFLLDEFSIDENEELSHKIDHAIFDDDLYVIFDGTGVVNLYFTPSQYLIPVFSDYEFMLYTLKDIGTNNLDVRIFTGEEILHDYFKDSGFFGLAINPPYYDYVLSCSNFELVK